MTDPLARFARTDDVRVRPALETEFEAVGRLTHAAYRNDYDLREFYANDLLHPETRVDDYAIWVADDAATGELLGTVCILRPEGRLGHGLREGELYFRLLAVSPTARRRGIGTRLTQLAFDIARERGLHTVALNSGPDMLAAHALYRSLGFVRDTARDVHFREGGAEVTIYTFTRAADLPAAPAETRPAGGPPTGDSVTSNP